MDDRRTTRRRRLPYVRSAVLEVGARPHIVAVADLGRDGAFLATQADVPPNERLMLRLVIPRDGREASIPCELVWRAASYDAATGRPAGLAVRFGPMDPSTSRRVQEFAVEGFLPAADAAPVDHFEYRIVERIRVDEDDLNRLGLDGWELATALPSQGGLRLVFLRRL